MRNVVEPGTDPAAVRLMALSMADQLWVIWLMAGIAVSAAGRVLAVPSTPSVASAAAIATCLSAAVMVGIRQVQRADRFLQDQLPADDSHDSLTKYDPQAES